MITAGIDCGAKNTRTVIMEDNKIIVRVCVLTGFDQAQAVKQSFETSLQKVNLSQDRIDHVAGTGSGSNSISNADIKVNDVKAIAAAAHYFFPEARTVVDVGAEESRAIKCDERGGVVDFAVNDKCAAGAGAFLEAMARALESPLEDMGALALSSSNLILINAQCAIFAESEVVGLIHAKTEKRDISKAIHDALARRIVSMIRRVGVNPAMVMLGGVANNPGFVSALKRELGIDKVYIPDFPEFGAAVGAAVVAANEVS